MVKVERSSSKAFEKILLKVSQLDGIEAKVGWFESAKYENGTPVAYVAAIQEFGSGPIPPRPFMRDAVASYSQQWAERAAIESKKVLDGAKTAAEGMEAVGLQAGASIQASIADTYTPPLSPLTIGLRAYKKKYPNKKITGRTLAIVSRMLFEETLDVSGTSTKPLNDTGYMLATVRSNTLVGGVQVSSKLVKDSV